MDFEKFLAGISSDEFVKVLDNADEQRKLKNHRINFRKMSSYYEAASKTKEFLKNGRGKSTFDNPKIAYEYHMVSIHLDNDEFDQNEIKQFTEIINLFDSMMIIGDSEGNIGFMLTMENLYVEKS